MGQLRDTGIFGFGRGFFETIVSTAGRAMGPFGVFTRFAGWGLSLSLSPQPLEKDQASAAHSGSSACVSPRTK
jgi:hypothetical protein